MRAVEDILDEEKRLNAVILRNSSSSSFSFYNTAP